MTTATLTNSRPRAPALLMVALLHAGLALWIMALRPVQHAAPLEVRWLQLFKPLSARAPSPVPRPTPTPSRIVTPAAPARTAPPAVATPEPTVAPAANAAPPSEGLAERLKAGAGKVDRDLRGGRGVAMQRADTPQFRLENAIAAAQRGPAWYQGARITPIADESGNDRKIYKVETALGTYCIYIESNHGADGIDVGQGLRPKPGNCPRAF